MKSSARKSGPALQTATLFAGVVLLLIVFVTVGYFFTIPTDAGDAPARDDRRLLFEKSRAKWAALSESDLSYVVERDCYCAPDYRTPYIVSVRDGVRTFRYTRSTADAERGATSAPPDPVTVDDLFELIDRALDSADSLSVLYNTEYGYPETLRIDWSTQIADEDQRFYVRDLRVLHQSGASL